MPVFTFAISDDDCSADGRNIKDSLQVHGGHLPFHELLHRCQQACFRFLHQLGGFDGGLVTPHVDADLHRAVDAGDLEIHVDVESAGAKSFVLRCEARQADIEMAVVRLVLVSYDYHHAVSIPLRSSQRDSLLTYVRR